MHPKKTPWAWVLATWFGAGLLKPGPGTYGSVAAMLLWVAAAHIWHGPGLAAGTAIAALVATLIGIPAATIVAREAGREDPGFVVIDEVAGQWIALIAIHPDWPHALLALLLFRLFDIWKHFLKELASCWTMSRQVCLRWCVVLCWAGGSSRRCSGERLRLILLRTRLGTG